MHKNLLWQAFLAVIFVVAIWYSIVAIYRYNNYSKLTKQAPISSINWTIKAKSEEEFLLEADYTFNIGRRSFSGITLLENVPHRNLWAAEKAIKEFSERKWDVWYDPTDPKFSSLEKKFPLKEIISASFLWILSLYFLVIGFYVAKFKN